MYSQESIDALINRIGWSELASGLPFVLSVENKTADSGKMFNWYHSLVLIDTIYAAVPEIDMNQTNFNQYLLEIKKQAVLNALTSILDTHVDYDDTKDYSSIILSKKNVFDDVIGYSVAVKMIELFISTSRKNFQERNAKLAYQTLKIELEGAKNENGHTVAKGLLQKLEGSIKKAQNVIFPVKIIVQNGKPW